MLSLGEARGIISLDASGFGEGVTIVTSGVEKVGGIGDQATRGLKSFGDQVDNVINSMGRFSGVARVLDGVATALGRVAVVGGVTLIAGGAKAAWDQVRSVQNATSALRAYEPAAAKVDRTLKGLLDYARSDLGVLFSRQELFAAAQGLKLYGAETNNLVRYVEIMSRSVGLGLSNWDQLGTVIGRVGSTGRLVGQDFDYLTAAGFRLDDSLRNTNVTWDSLFDALNRGMPADALAGIAQNIDGLVIRVRSAVRDIGNAFLGVDRDTSQFVEGGLGWYLVEGLKEAPGVIRNLTGLASTLGDVLSGLLRIGEGVYSFFSRLPAPIQRVITVAAQLLTTLGALRAIGSIGGILTSVLGIGGVGSAILSGGFFRSATTGSLSFGTALAGLVTRINPVGLALTAVGAAVAFFAGRMNESRRAAAEAEQAYKQYQASVQSLDDTIRSATLSGDLQLAQQMKNMRATAESELQAVTAYFEHHLAAWQNMLDEGFIRGTWDGQDLANYIIGNWDDAFAQANADGLISDFVYSAIMDGQTDALSRADWYEVEQWLDGMLEAAIPSDAQKAAVLESIGGLFELMGNELVDQQRLVSEFNDIWAEFGETGNIDKLISDLGRLYDETLLIIELGRGQVEYDYLSMMGMTDIAEDIQHLHSLRDAVASVHNELSPGHQQAYQEAWEGIFEAIRSGEYEADAILGKIRNLSYELVSGEIDALGFAEGIVGLFLDLDSYKLSADEASDSTDRFTDALKAGNEEFQAYRQRLMEIVEQRNALADAAGFDDPLSQWNLSGHATEMSVLAMNTQRAATALDNLYRVIVGNTNAIASQSQAIHDWAQELIDVQGEYSKLDDLVNAGRITGESGVFTGDSEYAQAQRAYNDIARENAEIQEHVLTIQAKQVPLIRDQLQTYENYLQAVADMPARQQLVALGWMDSASALQVMELQALSVAAANGDLGESGSRAFAQMAAGMAMTEPHIGAMLVDMGLLKEITDAETGKVIGYEVTMSGAGEVQSEIDRLTMAVLMLTTQDYDLAFEMAVDLYGFEEAERMFGLVDERDGKTVTETVMFETAVNGERSAEIKLPVVVDDGDLRPGIDALVADIGSVSIPVGIEEEGGPGGVEASFDTLIDGITNNISPVIIPVELRMPSSAASAGQSAGAAARGALDGLAADFTFTVSADTSAADSRLETINAALDTLRTSETLISVDADATQADAVLDNLQVRLYGYDGLISTTTLNADATQANAELDTLAERLSGYRNAVSTTTLEADDDQANKALDDLAQRLSGYRNLVSTTTLDANPASANVVLDLLGQRLSGYRNAVSTTTLDADSSSAHEVLRLLENRLREVDGSQAVVYLYAIDFATSTINSVSRDLTNLNGRTSTVYVDTVARGGGIVGRAGGGIVREPVTLVGEDGPELVALPYGSEVFSNSATMRMLREASSRSPEPVAAPQRSMSGTTVIDNSTHTTEYIALTESDFQKLLAKSERGDQAYSHLATPHTPVSRRGRR